MATCRCLSATCAPIRTEVGYSDSKGEKGKQKRESGKLKRRKSGAEEERRNEDVCEQEKRRTACVWGVVLLRVDSVRVKISPCQGGDEVGNLSEAANTQHVG